MTQNTHSTISFEDQPAVQRQLNVPVLVASIVAVVVVGAAVYFWHGYQLRGISVAFLDRATALEEDSSWRESAQYLHRYLQVHPEDADVQIRMAETYDKSVRSPGERSRAIELYFRAVGLATAEKQLELRHRLCEMLLESARYADAVRQARQLDTSDPKAQRTLAVGLLGQYEEGSIQGRNIKEANIGAEFQRAVELNPEDVPLAAAWAQILRDEPQLLSEEQQEGWPTAESRAAKADTVMDSMVTRNASEATAFAARSRYRSSFELPGAEDDLLHALELDEANTEILLLAARYYRDQAAAISAAAGTATDPAVDPAADTPVERRDALYAQSEKYYERLATESPAAAVVATEWGDVLLAQGNSERAIEIWQQARKQFTQPNPPLDFRLAELLIANDREDEASKILGEYEASDSPTWDRAVDRGRNMLRAMLAAKQERFSDAISLLKPVTTSGQSTPDEKFRAWGILGQSYAALRHWEQAAGAYEEAASLRPTDVNLRMAAAAAWRSGRQHLRAIDQYQLAQSLVDAPEVRIGLIESRLALQLGLPLGERDWSQLDLELSVLKNAKEQLDEPWRIDLMEAAYLAALASEPGNDNSKDQGLDVLRTSEQQYSEGNAEFLERATLLYEQLGASSDADRVLERVRSLGEPDTTVARLVASLYVAREEFDRAEQAVREIMQVANEDDASALQLTLVEVLVAAGKNNLAVSELKALYEKDPSNLDVIRRLAVLGSSADEAEQRKWEEQLVSLEGTQASLGHFLKARRLISEMKSISDPEFQEAIDIQRRLRNERPDWAETHLLQAFIAERRGALEEAVREYKIAEEQGGKTLALYERLISALYRLGRFAEAQEYLDALDEIVPDSAGLSQLAMGVSQQRNDMKQAVSIAKRGVDRRPEEPEAWVWYGQMLARSGELDAADAAFANSVKIAPERVMTWSALFAHQLSRGQTLPAQNTIRQMMQHAEIEEAQRPFLLAQAYELVGDVRNAAQQYLEASRLAPDSIPILTRLARFHVLHDRDAATETLEKILELEPENHEVRRVLAAHVSAHGGPTGRDRAEELLTQRHEDARVTRLDKRMLAALLVRRETPDLQRAQELLEELVIDFPSPAAEDRLLLASIYKRQGFGEGVSAEERDEKLAAAQKQYLYLCARTNPTPQHLAEYIDLLMRREDWDEASNWIDRLSARMPTAAGSAQLRAQWLAKQKKESEIPQMLAGIARQVESATPDSPQLAAAYEQLGQVCRSYDFLSDAESWFRRATDIEPRYGDRLVGSLIDQKKSDEAIALATDIAQSRPSAGTAAMLANTLVSAKARQADFDRAEPILTKALINHPGSAGLLLSMGNLRFSQHKIDEAVKMYEVVLKFDPNHVSTLNNLATMLAEQPGQRQAALRYIDQAIKLAGENPALIDTKGMILVLDERPSEGAKLLEKAANEGADPRYNFHLAIALHQIGSDAKARVAFKTSLQNKLRDQLLTEYDQQQLAELERVFQ